MTGSVGGRGKQKRTEATLARLLDAAADVFAQRGFRDARVQEICAVAEVAVGTFYEHFSTKTELLRAVLRERAGDLLDELHAEDLVDEARLVGVLERFFEDVRTVGIWRAWREAAVVDAALAASDEDLRATAQRAIARVVSNARRKASRTNSAFGPDDVAWLLFALLRDAVTRPSGEPRHIAIVISRATRSATFGP